MMSMKFLSGSRRFVILIGQYAIKIPKFTCFVSMIAGFRENQEERYWWCSESGVSKEWRHDYLNRIIWGDRFGFILIHERCTPLSSTFEFPADDDVIWEEINLFIEDIKGRYGSSNGSLPYYLTDNNPWNLGYNKDGKIVYIDYGYFEGTMDCYLGCKTSLFEV